MSEPYQVPVARLWSDEGSVVGAGFLAPRGVVVTCAHVVNDALGRDQLRSDEPRGEIRIDLPWAAGKATFLGSIVVWRPPIPPDVRRPDPCVDIAVLQLHGAEPPMEAALKPQSPAAVPEDVGFRVMGFPAGSDAGASARGTVRATDADGWHRVVADLSYGPTMVPGFSGAPAIADDGHRRLLGMIDVTNPDERSGVLIPVQALMRAWPPLAEPYRGLGAFREEDAAYFFGRDSLKARVRRSFERNKVTLLTGPSGSGKSSLLNAGLLPHLRRDGGWRLLRLRPGEQPMQRLGEELIKAFKPKADPIEQAERAIDLRGKLMGEPDLLAGYARALRSKEGVGLCILVDQFEEMFTLAQPSCPGEHGAFLATLTSLTRQPEPMAAKAVLALRSDFQTMLQSEPAAAELVRALDGEPTVLLRPLVPAELEQVIRAPLAADRLDVALDDGLLAQLLHDITRNADALPLLEFALTELWAGIRIDRAGRSLSRAAYDAMGGISGALAQHADAALTELQLGETETKRLFVELVRVGSSAERDTRRPRRKTELDAIDPALWPVAQCLAGRRLVVLTTGPAVDIVHEAILRQWPRLAGWIEAERDFLRWRQRLDERRREWDQAGQQAEDLLTGNALDEAGRWHATSAAALDEPQRAYIDASMAAQAATRCRREADVLWDRLELTWPDWDVIDHELFALFDLARMAPEIRHEFLSSALNSEPRARRLGRMPEVVMRAAVGLDAALAARVGESLVAFWRRGATLAYEQLWASISIGLILVDGQSRDLPVLLVERTTQAILGTTDPHQLRAYGEIVRTIADRVNAATIDVAACTLVERTAQAIAGTTDPDQLRACGEVVRTFAENVDAATARALVEHAVRAILGTVDPDQLQAWGEVVHALADRVDATSARTLVEHAVPVVLATTKPNELQAWGKIVGALADRVDAATVRTLAEHAVRAILGRASIILFQAYGEVLRALADRVDTVTACILVERTTQAITSTTSSFRLEAYGEVVRAFADRTDTATIDVAARTLVEHAVRVILGTTDSYQLRRSGEVVRAFAYRVDAATARNLVEHAVQAIPSNIYPSQPQAWGEFVGAFAGRVDTATARTLAEHAVQAIPCTSDPYQLQAWGKVVSAFAERIDATTARTLVEHAVRAIHSPWGADVFEALLDAVLSVRLKLSAGASAYLLSELLKHPLAGRRAPTRKLIAAIDDALGLGLPPAASLWQFLAAVAAADPSLSLAASYAGPEEILAGLRRRL